MQIDVYTKTMLTIIAMTLLAILFKPVFTPLPAHARDQRYSHIQAVSNASFFDTRTGTLYVYSGEELAYERRLVDLGLPMTSKRSRRAGEEGLRPSKR